MANVSIHPAIDNGVGRAAAANFTGGTLQCKCSDRKVTVSIKGQSNYNHACGCTKCWKPAGALFSVVAAVSRDNLAVTANQDKLQGRRSQRGDQALRLHDCGVPHVRAHRQHGHPLYGFDFVHTELSPTGLGAAGFAAFVSSIIESGRDPGDMGAVRARLKRARPRAVRLPVAALMDFIATQVAKASGKKRDAVPA
jgi:S-(hydroxymethyl)glutathione synthase